MHRVTIPDQKNSFFAASHQAIQKTTVHIVIHTHLLNHEPSGRYKLRGTALLEALHDRPAHLGWPAFPGDPAFSWETVFCMRMERLLQWSMVASVRLFWCRALLSSFLPIAR